jgi:hypothetical protein
VTAGPEAHPQLITHIQLRDEREDEGSRDDLSDAETRGTLATSTGEENHGLQPPTEAPQFAETETAENQVNGGTSIFAEGAGSAEERGKGDENESCDRGPASGELTRFRYPELANSPRAHHPRSQAQANRPHFSAPPFQVI